MRVMISGVFFHRLSAGTRPAQALSPEVVARQLVASLGDRRRIEPEHLCHESITAVANLE
jgi:hypothetical protein